jgi:hypothetical protein
MPTILASDLNAFTCHVFSAVFVFIEAATPVHHFNGVMNLSVDALHVSSGTVNQEACISSSEKSLMWSGAVLDLTAPLKETRLFEIGDWQTILIEVACELWVSKIVRISLWVARTKSEKKTMKAAVGKFSEPVLVNSWFGAPTSFYGWTP